MHLITVNHYLVLRVVHSIQNRNRKTRVQERWRAQDDRSNYQILSDPIGTGAFRQLPIEIMCRGFYRMMWGSTWIVLTSAKTICWSLLGLYIFRSSLKIYFRNVYLFLKKDNKNLYEKEKTCTYIKWDKEKNAYRNMSI